MKWLNHSLIAGSVCAVVSPPLVAAAVAGSTAPDWMEHLIKLTGIHIKHRSTTHIFTHWFLAALAFTFLWDYQGIGAAFFWGGISHILTDAMTVTGVPFSPYSDRRFHLFGGRFRTGEPLEYAIAAVVVAMCMLVMNINPSEGFAPFFYDWKGMYEQGVIDAHEWKTNRFKLI
jgi:inner membrane protein